MAAAGRLREAIAEARRERRCLTLPACHDGMSAVLVQRAGFPVCFMSGFAVSASQLALPDAGLISFGEQLQVGRNICEATRGRLLVIGDGDTGFGGSGNVRRTMRSYAAAGFAGITIEDQVYPKRCSYARGLAVEGREAAVARVRAAVASRDEMRTEGLDLVLVARTDCRNASAGGGLQEAIERCRAFAALGADVVYAEGLAGAGELRQLSTALPDTPTMLAQVERPGVPLIGAAEAGALGFSLSLLGVTVFNCALHAMRQALREMAAGGHPPSSSRMPFEELYREVGFDEHYSWEARFEGSASSGAAPAASGAQPAGGGSWGALPPEEKRSLQAKLDRMGSEQLDRVLEFLGPDVGDGEDEGEVDLDVDRLAPDRQLALVRFVDAALRSGPTAPAAPTAAGAGPSRPPEEAAGRPAAPLARPGPEAESPGRAAPHRSRRRALVLVEPDEQQAAQASPAEPEQGPQVKRSRRSAPASGPGGPGPA